MAGEGESDRLRRLTEPRRRLLKLIQETRHGEIRDLMVVQGEPVVDASCKVYPQVRMDRETTRRVRHLSPDNLKRQMEKLLVYLSMVWTGRIPRIVIQNGLSFKIELEQQAPSLEESW